ncbi:MAG: hypothetical protein VX738_04160 [Planctomycetota bacterium]|nr:hypothetical protein [Planctomycetota bacterium]
MKYLAFVLLLITCVGCSDDEIEPTKDTEALIDTPKTVEDSVSKTDEKVVTEMPETDVLSIDLAAALRGNLIRCIEDGKAAWMEFHVNGTFYHGTDLNGSPARKWSVTGNQVTIRHGDDDQDDWWFVFSDATLSPGSHILLLPSADAPESEGNKVTILSVKDIPPVAPLDSRLPFTVSRETTYITTPLRDDGYPDYVAAINGIASRDVTPENNAFIPLYELIYHPYCAPGVPGDPAHDWFFQELGIPPLKHNQPTEVGIKSFRFRSINWFANQAVGRKAKAELNRETGWYDLSPISNLRTEEILLADALKKELEKSLRRPWTRSENYLLARWLDYNEQVLERFRKATRRTRYYSPLLDYREGPMSLLAARMIGTSELRAIAKVALVRATLNLGEGRIYEAIQDALACHRLGRLICQQPTTLSMMTGLAQDREACQADMLIAHHGKLTLEQLTNWRQELQRLQPLLKMVDMLDAAGRYDFLDGALSVAQYGPKAFQRLEQVSGAGNWDDDSTHPHEWLRVPFNRRLVGQLNRVIDWDEVLREGNHRYDLLVAAGRRNTCQERMQAKDKWIQTFLATSTNPKLNLGMTNLQAAQDDGPLQKAATKSIIDILTDLYLSTMENLIDHDDRALMKNYLVGLSLSLAHYRLEKGSYPENLSQLSPQYIGKVPDDFFVGQPLRYERKEMGYILYSQGPNRKDDSGRPYSDIVFQVPLPALDEN